MNILALVFHNLENSRCADDDIVACVAYISHETAQICKYKQYASTQSLIWNVKTLDLSLMTHREQRDAYKKQSYCIHMQ